MISPGPRNLITDVAGIAVGNAADAKICTGVTAVLCDQRAVAAVDVRGGAPGTRETDVLNPACLVEAVDGIILSGGSVFGLDAGSGAVEWLRDHGRGLAIGSAVVPIVPTAVLFDLNNGGDKAWGPSAPYRDLAKLACDDCAGQAGSGQFSLGNVGAGFGATAGKWKGGLGSASAVDGDGGHTVGALIAVNSFGDAVMPGQASLWAWMLEMDQEMGGQPVPAGPIPRELDVKKPFAGGPKASQAGGNTVIGVVATDAALTKAECARVATMAHDGIARAVHPSHTPFDGDTLFVLATGQRALCEPRAGSVMRIGANAADTVARAVARGVFEAEPLGDWPGYRSVYSAQLTRSK